jgi:hypothetical protein
MVTTVKPAGRMCNQIIRAIAVSILAKKFDLRVDYCKIPPICEAMGIPLYNGTIEHGKTVQLTDDNFMEIYLSDSIETDFDPNTPTSYFQTKEISKLVYDWLQANRQDIIEHNPFKKYYGKNRAIFVHCRLTDAATFSPGYDYYAGAIRDLQQKEQTQDTTQQIIIGTDDPQHSMVQQLVREFGAEIMNIRPEHTIQCASTCKYIVLSHGSFSAMIGWLAFSSSMIYYPPYKQHMWFGDMFSGIPTFTCFTEESANSADPVS